MKKLLWTLSLAGSLLAGTIVQAADNPDIQFASASSNVTLLNQRIDQLESRLAAFESFDPSYDSRAPQPSCHRCGQCNSDGSCWCSPCAGAFVDAELLLLAWHDTDGDDSQDTLYSGSRFTLGYMNHEGRAIRARYMEFESSDELGTGELGIEHFDLEYAGRFALGRNWLGELSLGGRWASLSNPTPRLWTDSYGPLVGLGMRSEIRDWLSVYGNARQSFQFGSEDYEDNENNLFGISELAIGIELSHAFRCHEIFFRSGVEAQYYSSVRDDEEDYGLIGCTFALGLRH